MGILLNWILTAVAIVITAYLLPGVHVNNITTALITAVLLGIVNAVLKPIFIFFTLPLTIVTLGLFIFVINALLILLVSAIVPGFKVDNFWWALLFSIILSIITSVLHKISERFK